MRALVVFPLLLASVPAAAEDDVPDLVDAMGVRETRFVVGPAPSEPRAPPEVDDPVRIPLARDTDHRDAGRAYLDPFVGREVYPELSVRLATGLVRRRFANGGEPGGGGGRMALVGRADVSLWFVDLRLPVDATRRGDSGPFEVVFKAPLALGRHRIAPMLVLHVPEEGIDAALVEIGFGYHYVRHGLGLALQVSAFDGPADRQRGAGGGKIGWNGQLGYLVTDRFGVVLEADGVTAISERSQQPPPSIGDTLLRILPGVRFFLGDSGGVELGVAGLFSIVPDGYGVRRDQGVLLDLAYTFF